MQHLHHRQAGVETDEIGELQGTHRMIGAQAHRRIDRLDGADAFVKRVDRFVDHRQQDTVDDKGRKIFGDGDSLAKPAAKFLRRLKSFVLGGDAANKLDELHARHRIHEMNADEAFRPAGNRGEACDRDRRGVGGDDRLRIGDAGHFGQDRAFDLFVLGGGLDNQIGVREVLEVRRAGNVRQGGVDVPGRQVATLHRFAHLNRNILDGGVDPIRRHIVEDHIIAGERANLRNAFAHLSRADDANPANLEAHCPITIAKGSVGPKRLHCKTIIAAAQYNAPLL